MLEALSGIFASSGLGAIIGTIGSYLGKIEERKAKAQEYGQELALREWDAKETALSQRHEMAIADKEIQRAETEGAIALDAREADGWVESIKQSGKQSGIVIVDAIRGLMRPVITVYLLVIASVIAYRISMLVGGLEALPMEEMVSLYRHVISQIIFLTATAVTWWFGSRPQSKAGR